MRWIMGGRALLGTVLGGSDSGGLASLLILGCEEG